MMVVDPALVALTGTVHAALACTTNAAGQTVCSGASTGLSAGFGILIVFYLALAVLGIVAAVKVVSKAGYSGWWVLIGFVPLVGTIFVLVFAFSTWPVTRELEMLKVQLARTGGYGRPGGYGGMSDPGRPGPGPFGPMAPAPTAPEPAGLPTFGQFIQGGPVNTQAPVDPAGHPPAGWFPSPGGPPGQHRYWDGTSWTDKYH
jgi:energy-coupling factor transporter transmembrane protein EcfT